MGMALGWMGVEPVPEPVPGMSFAVAQPPSAEGRVRVAA